jgi:hypothetical protein
MELRALTAGIIPLSQETKSDEALAKKFSDNILSGAKKMLEAEGKVIPTFFILGNTPQGPGALVLSPPLVGKEDREISFAIIRQLAEQIDAFGVMLVAEVAGAFIEPEKANEWFEKFESHLPDDKRKDFLLAVYEHRLLGTHTWLSAITQDGEKRSLDKFLPIDMDKVKMKEEMGSFLPPLDISELN